MTTATLDTKAVTTTDDEQWYVDGVLVIEEIPLQNLPKAPLKISRIKLIDGQELFKCRECDTVCDTRGDVVKHRTRVHGTGVGGRKYPRTEQPELEQDDDPGYIEPELSLEEAEVPLEEPGDAEPESEVDTVEEMPQEDDVDVDVLSEAPEYPVEVIVPEALAERGIQPADRRSALEMTLGELLAVAPSIKAMSDYVARLEHEVAEAREAVAKAEFLSRANKYKIDCYEVNREELAQLRQWKKRVVNKMKLLGFTLSEEDAN